MILWQLFYTSSRLSSHLNFYVAPQLSKLLLFLEIINFKISPCCHLGAVISSSLSLFRKNITNCVQVTKLSEDNISSDKKTWLICTEKIFHKLNFILTLVNVWLSDLNQKHKNGLESNTLNQKNSTFLHLCHFSETVTHLSLNHLEQ